MERRSRGNSAAAGGLSDSSFDKEAYAKNRAKIAVLTSEDTLDFEVMEGTNMSLEFTVENQSEMAWPFKPLVMDERKPEIKQQVNALLQPGQSTVVKYVYRAPLYQEVNGKKVSILLQLVDPNQYDKFCEETIAVRVKITQPGDELDFDQSEIMRDNRHTEYLFGSGERMS